MQKAIDNANQADAGQLAEELIPAAELNPVSVEEVLRLPRFRDKMRQCENCLGVPYAAIPRRVQDALVLRRAQQLVNTMMLNPLWRERIEAAGLKEAPRDFEAWQQLPLCDKGSVNDLFVGERPGMVVPLSRNGFEIVASGGTSGVPAETVYSIRELHDTYRIAGEFMGRHVLADHLVGDGPKWVATTLADYQMWSSGTMVGGVLQNIPGINYIGAGPVMKEVFQHMMSYPGPKAIMGISQSIAILPDLGAELDEEARNSLRVALYGSGVLAARKQAELKAHYPNASILSYFATVQAETIGLQRHSNSHLAAVPGLHLIEIVDENGRWVAEGEEGELVVTRLHAHQAPVLRFKVGDRTIRRPDLDEPELKTMQFEFLGRSSDVIHLRDTQYDARQAYSLLCWGLERAGAFNLDAIAHEYQFANNRREGLLVLIAAVDNAQALNSRMRNLLGPLGIHRLFVESLASSLSIFNSGEAAAHGLEREGYRFDIRLVERASPEIHRTTVGKVPLIRDVF